VTSWGWVSPERQAPYYMATHLHQQKKVKCVMKSGKKIKREEKVGEIT